MHDRPPHLLHTWILFRDPITIGSAVRDHADMDCVFVGGYVASMDGKQCVCSFDIFPNLHEASKFSAGHFAPGGAVLAVNTSGEEVADTCFCASGWVHDRVG